MLPPLPANVQRARTEKAPSLKLSPELSFEHDDHGRLKLCRPLAVLGRPGGNERVIQG
jgi:hypothetical protein